MIIVIAVKKHKLSNLQTIYSSKWYLKETCALFSRDATGIYYRIYIYNVKFAMMMMMMVLDFFLEFLYMYIYM